MLYLIVYVPFEDKIIQYINVITEIGISITLICLSGYFLEISESSVSYVDDIVMYLVALIMLVQTIGPILITVRTVYLIIKQKMTKNGFKNSTSRIKPIHNSGKNGKRIDKDKLEDFFGDEDVSPTSPAVTLDEDYTVGQRPNQFMYRAQKSMAPTMDSGNSEDYLVGQRPFQFLCSNPNAISPPTEP